MKRTPLTRKTPLRSRPIVTGEAPPEPSPGRKAGSVDDRPRKPLQRSGSLRPMSPRRQAEVAERKRVRKVVLERDGHRCQGPRLGAPGKCWHPVDLAELDVHEIVPRSAWRAGYLEPDNCLSLCRRHHDWVDDQPKAAKALGLRS